MIMNIIIIVVNIVKIFHLVEKTLSEFQTLKPLLVHSIHLSELGLNSSFLRTTWTTLTVSTRVRISLLIIIILSLHRSFGGGGGWGCCCGAITHLKCPF